MNRTSQSGLSQNEELLIMQYFDQETSFWGQFRAKRLLASSELARDFLSSLESGSQEAKAILRVPSAVDGKELDLWDRIAMRIDQEERAEVYLGKRSFVPQDSSLKPRFFGLELLSPQWMSRAGWSLSGAVAAMAFAVLVVGGEKQASENFAGDTGSKDLMEHAKEVSIPSMPAQFASVQSGPADSVSRRSLESLYQRRMQRRAVSNRELQQTPRIIDESPLDFDWMRSDGRVTFVQDVNRGSTIIWVNKPTQMAARLSQRSETARVPSAPVIVDRESRIPRANAAFE
ncbi:MAG: hypothetical protein KDD53_08920 [Bdellovibrionales bacterium]|nr:hypothetical protein [Bdellovibrionales bacterium]